MTPADQCREVPKMLKISTNEGVKRVKSLGEINLYGHRCFLHESYRSMFCGTWKLTEFSTGLAIGDGNSASSATRNARDTIRAAAKKQSMTPKSVLAKSIAATVAKKGRVNA